MSPGPVSAIDESPYSQHHRLLESQGESADWEDTHLFPPCCSLRHLPSLPLKQEAAFITPTTNMREAS